MQPMAGMRHNALTATLWSAADILLRQGVQFVISIALARLVLPEEFGAIAVLYLFADIAGVPGGCTMAMALIQRQDVTRTDESTVFWFNLGAGCAAALLLYLCAPAIAALYAAPVLVPLTAVMAMNIVIVAPGSIQTALFTKRLDFRPLMRVSIISVLSSGSAAIAMAKAGFGVWALAAQLLIYSTTATTLLWLLSPWRPAFVFSVASVRRLFRFGSYMMASTLLNLAYCRLYAPLIGKLYGMRELGIYNRADAAAQLPGGLLHSVVERVAFPLFSASAGNKALLQRDVRMGVQSTMLLNAPMMLGLAAVANPLVLTLFGEKWLPSVPILQVLCISGLLLPLHNLNIQMLMALGHSHLCFRIEVIKKVMGVTMLLAGSLYGAIGVALGVAAASMFAFPISAHYTRRLLGYGVFRQFCDVLPAVGIALVMACMLLLLQSGLTAWIPAMQLAIAVIVGGSVFAGLSLLLRLPALTTLWLISTRPQTSDV